MSLNGEGADVTVTPPPVLLSDSGGVVILPDAAMVFDAEFVRANTDLILRNSGAPDIRVTDYFKQAEPSDLVTQDGAVLRGATVQRLAGPEAPGQYAQAGSANAANPIGQVEAVSGQAQVQRADGAVDDLQVGTKIFTDDVLQTGEAANLSVTFVDGTIFTLAPESRMVVDALIYDPDSQDNAGAFSLIQGGFVFIAGQVAATGGMEVQTPSSTMGIRGTTVLVDLQTNGAITTTAVTLTRDPDGGLGRVELFDLSGNLITTITSTTTKWIVSTLQGETREVDRTAEDEAEDSVLLIEAVAAYQSAFARFEQGGTFVELDRVGRGDGAADFGDSDVDLDSIDDEPVPEVTPPSLPDPQNGGSFDEGNLDIEGVIPSERVIVLTGFEDSAEDAEFSGSLAALTSGAGTFSLVSTPQNGTVDLQTDGTYSFVPDLNFNGTDQFRYDLVGPSGVLESGTVQITVLPVNDAPQIEPDNRSVDEDIILTGLAAATDVDGDDLQYTLGTGAQNGSASVARDGAWSYTADPDFAGQDSFEIVVTDAAGAQATQAVNIDVIGQPDAPRITSDISDATGGVVEDDAPQIGGTLTATDPDAGATLSWSGSTAGSVGTFVISAAGVWTYTLAAAAQMLQADETVAESFVATVTDDTGLVASQVVNITVTGTNDTPIIVSDASNATGNVIETSSPVATGVLTATDVDAGAELAWSGSETGSLGVFEISPDGAWSYMLGTAAEGLAAGQVATESFTATVTDGLGGVADQTVTLTVTGSNDGPVITSAGSAAQGAVVENVAPVASGVLTASDVDDGATLTWAGTATGALGTFTIDPTGAWTYTLTAAADGLAEGTTTTEAFVATVSDGQGATATQTVTVSITGRNDAPMVVAEQSVAQGMATENTAPVATGLLIASDADLDATLRWSGTASGDFGDFTITEDGAWSYTLNAAAEALAAGQVERESFTALVTDDQGAVATQVVTTTIVGTNDAPTAEAFDIEVTQGQTVMALLTADDIDINDVLDFALAPSAAPAGAVELASDGTLSYTGASDFVGLDQFDYVVSDGAGGSFAATVSVFVESAEQTGTGGQKVTLNIYPDPVVGPAGTIVTTASAANSSNVNLVVALDRSGSIGEEAWETKINAVADALAEIAPTFDGAQTQVDVQIITYATTSQVEGTFDLTDPALLTTLRTLPFTGGGTNWDQPLEQAEAFYDAQPAGEVNFLYFITDGDPSNNAWEPVLARLTDAETKGYDLVIEAFGIGNDVALNNLEAFDPTPQLLAGSEQLSAAFAATPLFAARLVDLSVNLIADGQPQIEIADETFAGLTSDGFETRLSLAEIPGLIDLLGDENRITVTAGFDLDGDTSATEISLFSTELFAKASTTQTLTGTDGSDLLFGSDHSDVLSGAGGGDILLGFGGADTLTTGTGVDHVRAGDGDDRIVVTSLDAATAGVVENLDGGAGRDVLSLAVETSGAGPDLFDLVDLSGIEALDLDNGLENNLTLELGDILGLSDTADETLESLLASALPDSVTLYADGHDSITLLSGPEAEVASTGQSVVDSDGTTLDIYQFSSGGDVLATLAIDSEATVSAPAIT